MLVVGCQVYARKVPPSDGASTNHRSGSKSLFDPPGANYSGVGAFFSLVVTA